MPSYSQPDRFTQLRGQMIRSGAPFTLSVVGLSLALFLVDYFSSHKLVPWFFCTFDYGRGASLLSLAPHALGHGFGTPWGPFVYPLMTPDFVGVLFASYGMWWIGGSLERAWGTRRFAYFALACTLATFLFIWLGCVLLHDGYALLGLYMPLAPMVVAWAMLNRSQTVLLAFILPVPAIAVAALTVGLIYFEAFSGQFILGLFGLLPCLMAYLYATGRFSYGYRGYARRGPDLRISGGNRGKSILDGSRPASGGPAGWFRAWQERRRLRKLWRDSGFRD